MIYLPTLISIIIVTVSVLLSLFIFIYNINFNVPKPHTFVCLPLESRIFGNFNLFSLIRRSFTWPKLLGGLSTVAIIALARYGYYGNIKIDYTAFLSNTIWGCLLFILKSVFITFFEDLFLSFKLPMFIFDDDLKDHKLNLSKKKRYSVLNMDKGKGIDTNNNINEGSFRGPRSTTPLETDKNYWEAQCKIFRDGLSSLNKADNILSEDELYAKRELLRLKLYTEQEMIDALNENQRNVDFPTDEDSLRRQNVLNKVSRAAEMQTESYKYKQAELLRKETLIKETQLKKSSVLAEIALKEKSIIKDSVKKLKEIAVYNDEHKASISASSSVPGNAETKLSKTENDTLVDIISKDKYAPLDVRSKIINKTIEGKIGSDSAIIKYLDKKSK